MTHDAKFEWWILAAIGLGLVVILVGGNHWIGGAVLLVLLIRAYPQRYVTTPDGLLIRAGLANRLIPVPGDHLHRRGRGRHSAAAAFGRNGQNRVRAALRDLAGAGRSDDIFSGYGAAHAALAALRAGAEEGLGIAACGAGYVVWIARHAWVARLGKDARPQAGVGKLKHAPPRGAAGRH